MRLPRAALLLVLAGVSACGDDAARAAPAAPPEAFARAVACVAGPRYFPAPLEHGGRYRTVLTLLREKRLCPLEAGVDEVYRFTLVPSVTPAIAMRLSRRGEVWTMISRRAAEQPKSRPRPEPQELWSTHQRVLTAGEAESLRGALAAARFWSLPAKGAAAPGQDGTSWVMEGVRDGFYHATERWEPARGEPAYHALGLFLLRLSGFSSPELAAR
ncbi:MAG TPA: hypothetical protein VEX86_06645 [Longimicrobium sp.]|nr:hypothetical protein [Longimicrobium sp.]